MRRFYFRTAAATVAAVLLVFGCMPRCFAVSARSAIVIDVDSGRVLYEKNADDKSLIASTTKIMTGLIVCEQCNVLDRFEIPQEAVGIEGSSMYLRAGEVLTVQELLYGLLLSSGNDAAVALAIYCGGTVEGFVAQMNDRARRLGMTGTNFQNPNGLDQEEHYSTARDMALLAACAMKNAIFSKTVSTKTVRIGERTLVNHNKLLWRYSGADGVKTGYTRSAGRVLVSSAVRDGRRLVAVTINAPDDWNDHAALLDQGFSCYQMTCLVRSGQKVGTLQLISGMEDAVGLEAAADFSYPIAEGERVRMLLRGPGFAYAPVRAGEKAGTALIMVNDMVVGHIPLVWTKSVGQLEADKSWFKRWLERLYERTDSENFILPRADVAPGG